MDRVRPFEGASDTLSAQLRDRTKDAHHAAERSGVMAALLRGQMSRSTYALLLRSLEGEAVADPRRQPAMDAIVDKAVFETFDSLPRPRRRDADAEKEEKEDAEDEAATAPAKAKTAEDDQEETDFNMAR